jgi:WD40 repeat protein
MSCECGVADPLGIEGRDFRFPAAGMDEEEGKQLRIFDFHFLYSGLDNGQIVVWTPLAEEKTSILISQHSRCVESLSFSPDGRFLASMDPVQKLIIWSAEVEQENETDNKEEVIILVVI